MQKTETDKVYPSIIDGKDIYHNENGVLVTSASNRPLYRFSPFSISDESMYDLATNAKQGFHEWSSFPTEKKVEIFNKAKELLKERKEELKESHLEIDRKSVV